VLEAGQRLHQPLPHPSRQLLTPLTRVGSPSSGAAAGVKWRSRAARVTTCHDLSRDMSRLQGAKSLGKIDLVTMSRLQPPGDTTHAYSSNLNFFHRSRGGCPSSIIHRTGCARLRNFARFSHVRDEF
jgi:hypothetical protein